MSLSEPPKKRKRLSRNKKKNWAKTDITDIEEHLERERIQLRTGGLVEAKTDEQLFFVDKNDAISEQVDGKEKPGKKEIKPLKCHAHLTITTGSPAIIVSQGKANSNKKKKKHVPSESRKSRLIARQQRQDTSEKKKKEVKEQVRYKFDEDLWTDDKPDTKSSVEESVVHKQKVKIPDTLTKRYQSDIAHVETAHPGQSYNPAFDDHQEILQKALDVELDREKKNLKLKRALDDAFPEASKAQTEASYISEMSAGLFVTSDDSDADEENTVVNPPVRRENKKTDKQRRREAAQKEKEAAKQAAKEAKKKKNEIFQIKSIKKEVNKREAELVARQKERDEKATAQKDRTKKLSKYKFEDPNIRIKLSHEIQQSLRLLKPEGSVLEDRFKSLQKRNLIETRQKQKMKRKYKPKTFEKKGHKAVDE